MRVVDTARSLKLGHFHCNYRAIKSAGKRGSGTSKRIFGRRRNEWGSGLIFAGPPLPLADILCDRI